jgi:probable phosphoglycerate mutase
MPWASTRPRARVPGAVFDGRMGEVVVIRHGQTEWSKSGQHTSVTDLPLLPEGEDQARNLRRSLAGRRFVEVWVSPRQRALHTAELAGLTPTRVEEDLVEVDYGGYEGRTGRPNSQP